MLTQHNQEFRRYDYNKDPLSLLGVGSGHDTTPSKLRDPAHQLYLVTDEIHAGGAGVGQDHV